MKKSILMMILLLFGMAAGAQDDNPNARQARRIFERAYDKVFGPQGSSLDYDVNIVHLYKTKGRITFKGKKKRFSDQRADSWSDGKTSYTVYRKKKTVEIHDANSNKKDKYSSKFKFEPDDFNYSIEEHPEGLLISLKQKKKAKGSIKEVKAVIDRKTLEPKKVRIRVAIIWTTIKIANFKSGGITDDMFVFPADDYREGYKFIDKRESDILGE